jgi:hypothetical protein
VKLHHTRRDARWPKEEGTPKQAVKRPETHKKGNQYIDFY